jgi:hypothetical protein
MPRSCLRRIREPPSDCRCHPRLRLAPDPPSHASLPPLSCARPPPPDLRLPVNNHAPYRCLHSHHSQSFRIFLIRLLPLNRNPGRINSIVGHAVGHARAPPPPRIGTRIASTSHQSPRSLPILMPDSLARCSATIPGVVKADAGEARELLYMSYTELQARPSDLGGWHRRSWSSATK